MKKVRDFLKWIIFFIKDIPRQWKAETPKIAKWVRNTFATLGSAALAFNTAVTSISAITPSWYSDNIWFIIGGCAAITVIAGTKEVKPPPTQD